MARNRRLTPAASHPPAKHPVLDTRVRLSTVPASTTITEDDWPARTQATPARQSTIDTEPGGFSPSGISQAKLARGLQQRMGRNRPNSRPAGQRRQVIQRGLCWQARGKAPGIRTEAAAKPGWHAFSPMPTAVADADNAAELHGQMPSPITPGTWMPHSCLCPPKRVLRPSLPSHRALECQSPTVEYP